MKLTKSIIDKITYDKNGKARDLRWDSELAGFGVRVYPSDKKAFVLSYSLRGRKHLMVIGAYGVLTLEQARNEARRALIKIMDGLDPLADRQKNLHMNVMKDLCEQYIERHAKIHKKSWKDDQRRLAVYVLPVWSNFQVASLTRSDVASLHQKIGKKSIYDANRTLALLATMFKFGQQWGFLEPTALNPARGIKMFKELSRDRWLTPDEMPKVAESIDAETNPYIRAAIWLYLLTGMRRSELLGVKWCDVDFERKEVKLEDTKNGSRHYVPLSEPALALLRNIPKSASNPFIIVGQKPGYALVNISKPWDRIRKRAGVTDVRIHDLRRTTGSWLAQKGNSLHLIARVLNHRSSNTTKIYARFAQDHVREALDNHGREIFPSVDQFCKAKNIG